MYTQYHKSNVDQRFKQAAYYYTRHLQYISIVEQYKIECCETIVNEKRLNDVRVLKELIVKYSQLNVRLQIVALI